MGSVVAIVAAALGGGGVFAFLQAWMDGRRQAKQRSDEAPERRESLTVEGSAKAVITMDQALTAANERAEQAEKDVASLRTEIRQLRTEHRQEIDDLRAEHNREITDLRQRFETDLDTMRAQIGEAYRTRPNVAGDNT